MTKSIFSNLEILSFIEMHLNLMFLWTRSIVFSYTIPYLIQIYLKKQWQATIKACF